MRNGCKRHQGSVARNFLSNTIPDPGESQPNGVFTNGGNPDFDGLPSDAQRLQSTGTPSRGHESGGTRREPLEDFPSLVSLSGHRRIENPSRNATHTAFLTARKPRSAKFGDQLEPAIISCGKDRGIAMKTSE